MSGARRRSSATPLLVVLTLILLAACSHRPGGFFGPDKVLDAFVLRPVEGAVIASPTPLADFTSDELYGRLSPDGFYLVYASNQKGNLDIWLRDLSSGIPTRLTDHVAVDTQPTFSPDGERIVFVSMRDDVKGDVYLIDIDGDKLTRLTDRTTEDAYPVFHPDGESLIFASGPEEQTHIVRMWLKDKRIRKLTGPGATQPAISPDGRYLAWVQRGEDRVNRVMLSDLKKKQTRTVSVRGYQCGFPTFSPDGRQLYFTRFYYTQPYQPLDGDENGVIWQADLARLWSLSEKKAESAITQISSGKDTHLFLSAHKAGLVFTTRKRDNLDVLMMPFGGLFPELDSASEQLQFAQSLENPFDRLVAYRKLQRFKGSPEAVQAMYQASRIDSEQGWYDKQLANLKKLDRLKDAPGDWQGLARVDLAVWEVESTVGLAVSTGVRLTPELVTSALDKLEQVFSDYGDLRHVQAYAFLRKGDMLTLIDRQLDAVEAYETVSTQYGQQADVAVLARIRLGDLFGQLGSPDLQSCDYFISVFRDFPKQEREQRLAADRVIAQLRQIIAAQPEIAALLNPPEFDETRHRIPEALRESQRKTGRRLVDQRVIDELRRVIEAHPQFTLLGAILQYRIGEIYHRLGQLDLAIRAMQSILTTYTEHQREITAATFALGEYSLEFSKQLRAAGRHNEAGRTYAQALGYYERITKMYPEGDARHQRARREFMSLGLLKAGQEEREGDIAAAIKSYRRLLHVDPTVIQAHRKLIYYGVLKGDYKKLEKKYEAMIDADEASFVGHYCLGYLYTWQKNLSVGDLEDAEDELVLAMSLNSQSPYVYLTLGWVSEMYELYGGDFTSGWIEEAIKMYDMAWRVNDRGLDLQVEADILLNLGNGFVQLGNTWHYAYDFYHQRLALNLPFIMPVREALFYLNLGRAAFNLNHYDEASRHFDRALQLARESERPRLMAEAIARQALNLQMQGNYELSIQFYERSIATYRDVGQMDALAALVRSVALNYFYLGKRSEAVAKLKQSLDLLDAHGTRDPGEFTRLALGSGMSLAPRGFDKQREQDVNASLRALILEDLQQFNSAEPYLDEKAGSMQAWLAASGGEDPDIMREIIIVENQRARMAVGFGEDARAVQYFVAAYDYGDAIQSTEVDPEDPAYLELTPAQKDALILDDSKPPRKLIFSAEDFAHQLINATAAAELLLRRDAGGVLLDNGQIATHLKRLARLHKRLEYAETEAGAQLIASDLRWRLCSDLALLHLLSARQARSQSALQAPDVTQAFASFVGFGRHFTEAIRLLQQVVRESAPPSAELLAEARAQAESDMPQQSPPHLRLRMHVQALMNLAEVADYFETDTARSHAFLERAQAVCADWRLDDICQVLDVTLAARKGDLAAAQKAVATFIDMPPGALPEAYLQSAELTRHKIFAQSAALALKHNQPELAWNFLEQEARRLPVDELAKLESGVRGSELAALLGMIRNFEQQRRSLVEAQSAFDDEATRTARNAQIDKLSATIRMGYLRLQAVAPRLYDLLTVTPFSPADARRALGPTDAAVSFALFDGSVHAFVLTAEDLQCKVYKKPAGELLGLIRKYHQQLNDVGSVTPAAYSMVGSALLRPLRRELKDVTRLYIDGDRLYPNLPWQGLLTVGLKHGARVNRIASLRGLRDSFDNRDIAFGRGWITLSAPRPEQDPFGEKLQAFATAHAEWNLMQSPELTLAAAQPYLQTGGVFLLNQTLGFEGKSAANMWLQFDTPQAGFGQLLLPATLDAQWTSNLIVFAQVRHTGRLRAERLCLERLLNARGVGGYVTNSGSFSTSAALADGLLAFATGIATQTRQQSLQAAIATLAENPQDRLWADRLQLWGFVGLDEAGSRAFASERLFPAIKEAIAFQKANAPRAAVEAYEEALRLMDYLGDAKYLDSVLTNLVQQSAAIADWERTLKYQHRVLARVQAVYDADPQNLAKFVPVLKAKEALANYYLRARDFEKALDYNKQIIDALIEKNREPLTATYHAQRGIYHEYASQYENALEEYLTALKLYKAQNNVSEQVKQSTDAARVLRMYLARYRLARQYLEAALELAVKAPLYQRLRLKLELTRVHFALGNFQMAADMAREIIAASQAELNSIMAQARVLAKDANLDAEKRNARLTELLGPKNQMDSVLIQAMLELVNALYRQGDYPQALNTVASGLKLAMGNKDVLKQIQFSNIKGLIYSQLGDTDQAIATFTWMLDQAKAIDNTGEQASALNNLGETYRKAGRFGKAREQFMLAMQIDQRTASRLGIAFDNANLGLTYENMQRFEEARQHLSEALKISREIGHPLNEAKSLLALGRIALGQRNLDEAQTVLNQGLALTERLHMIDWNWRFRLQRGRLLLAKGEPEQALADFLAGIDTVEQLPPAVRKQSGPKIEESTYELYDEAIDLLAQNGQAEKAFNLSERYRSRHFLDLTGGVRASLGNAEAVKLLQQEAQLSNALRSARDLLAKAKDDTKAEAQKQLEQVQADYDAVIKALADLNAELPAYLTIRTADSAMIRAKLPDNTPLVSYYATHKRLVIFVVDATGLQLQTVDVSRRELDETVDVFRRLVTHFHPVTEPAEQLYQWLIAPVKSTLEGSERVMLVPFGKLHTLPFAALHDGSDYLVARWRFAYLSAATQLTWLRTPAEDGEQASASLSPALAMGGPFVRPSKDPLGELPFTGHELDALAFTFPLARLLRNAEATLAAYRQFAPQAAWIHIATHAEFDPGQPFSSHLLLAPSGDSDGQLTLADILATPLHAQLVSLSACETGIGPMSDGDGQITLSRAYLSAGAERVLASLWRVSDLSTSVLMKHWFRQLRAQPVDIALQRAQQTLRKQFPHPAYWAGFRLEGLP